MDDLCERVFYHDDLRVSWCLRNFEDISRMSLWMSMLQPPFAFYISGSSRGANPIVCSHAPFAACFALFSIQYIQFMSFDVFGKVEKLPFSKCAWVQVISSRESCRIRSWPKFQHVPTPLASLWRSHLCSNSIFEFHSWTHYIYNYIYIFVIYMIYMHTLHNVQYKLNITCRLWFSGFHTSEAEATELYLWRVSESPICKACWSQWKIVKAKTLTSWF